MRLIKYLVALGVAALTLGLSAPAGAGIPMGSTHRIVLRVTPQAGNGTVGYTIICYAGPYDVTMNTPSYVTAYDLLLCPVGVEFGDSLLLYQYGIPWAVAGHSEVGTTQPTYIPQLGGWWTAASNAVRGPLCAAPFARAWFAREEVSVYFLGQWAFGSFLSNADSPAPILPCVA